MTKPSVLLSPYWHTLCSVSHSNFMTLIAKNLLDILPVASESLCCCPSRPKTAIISSTLSEKIAQYQNKLYFTGSTASNVHFPNKLWLLKDMGNKSARGNSTFGITRCSYTCRLDSSINWKQHDYQYQYLFLWCLPGIIFQFQYTSSYDFEQPGLVPLCVGKV